MPIADSKGGFYHDAFAHAAAPWSDPIDANPDVPDEGSFSDNRQRLTKDQNDMLPGTIQQNKELNDVDMSELGGIEVDLKNQMPFPDNRNPNTDFDSRFPKDLKSGILNDLRPTKEKDLSRKL